MEGPEVGFDIGGTWIRWTDFSDPNASVARLHAPSRARHPDADAEDLFQRLIDTIDRLTPARATVYMSLGAAIDHKTSKVLGSAPLWGDYIPSPDLIEQLSLIRPDVNWQVFNDVTCGLGAVLQRTRGLEKIQKLTYITVSTGIALRTVDLRSWLIPTSDRGLQGEVGHLPYRGSTGIPCPCGGGNHVASVASGHAVEQLLPKRLGLGAKFEDLISRLNCQTSDALEFLSEIVKPVADIVRTSLQLDPAIDIYILGGGVVDGLAPWYRDELIRQLTEEHRNYSQPYDQRTIGKRIKHEPELNLAEGARYISRSHLVESFTDRGK